MKQKKGIMQRGMILLLTAFLLICQAIPVFAVNIPRHTDDFYVNDFSGILSAETKNQIMKVNLELNKKTGAQVVVVTMDTLDGEDLEIFATDLFRAYGIGDSNKNNGVLFLLVKEDREVRIEVGYGLEGAINDANAGRILDTYVVPYLEKDRWDEGVYNGFKAIVWEIEEEYATDIESNVPNPYAETDSNWFIWSLATAILSLVLGIIITLVLRDTALKTVKWILMGWLAGVFFTMLILYGFWTALFTIFISSVAALFGYCAVSPDDGTGYSSSSGRSSHSSSRSSGSSGHRYSGGGGRSGGGGASRRF